MLGGAVRKLFSGRHAYKDGQDKQLKNAYCVRVMLTTTSFCLARQSSMIQNIIEQCEPGSRSWGRE